RVSPSSTGSASSAQRPALSANTIPRLPRLQELTVRAVALLALLYSIYWIWWRWTATLNPDHWIFSIVLVTAETTGLLSMCFFIFNVWKLERREPPPAPDRLSVDVFITCFDEPLQLIRRTAIGARAIRYPHGTYILDDGKREEVKAMAIELGIGYIRRKGNEHAKAGNLNHALSVTTAEFILQLDADHVPLPNILDRMLGYFENPQLAMVQSPQDFYNTDSFTHVVNDDGRRLWEENRLFFSIVQPGLDRNNASFFCGSCGVLRRAAIDEIGGFSTQTITEDMETSLLLHARGWTTYYHGETLAYGLAPANATQYHVQRLRWGQGTMQIMRKMNPLFMRGLTWRQRLSYFSALIIYLDAVQRLVFYLAPAVFFLTGWLPVSVSNREFLVRLIPFMILRISAFELLARGTGYMLIAERYNMTRFWTYLRAIGGFFARKPLRFNVTPKGPGDVPFKTYAPQFWLCVISVVAVMWAMVARPMGWIDYGDGDGGLSAAFIVNGVWLGWNLYFAAYVVQHSIRSKQLRSDYRFAQRITTRIRPLIGGDLSEEGTPATTEDINSTGLSFRCTKMFPPDTLLEIPLQLSAGLIVTYAIVTHATPQQTKHGVIYHHGAVFQVMPIMMRDAIELHSAHHAIPLARQHYRQSMTLVQNAVERFINARNARRRPVGLPALIGTPSEESGVVDLGMGLLEDESSGGVRFILDIPLQPGAKIRWDVPGTSVNGEGTVVYSRLLESQLRPSFVVGVERTVTTPNAPGTLRRWIAPARAAT
ncbi:MAG: restriction endonuclease, partial [Gemmatimonadetes bacterium]|nr:restriction endonuclease [Gemmatimonadota bacterium]